MKEAWVVTKERYASKDAPRALAVVPGDSLARVTNYILNHIRTTEEEVNDKSLQLYPGGKGYFSYYYACKSGEWVIVADLTPVIGE
jgi:hypothetical protein